MNYYLKNKIQKLINETLEDKANEVMEKLKLNKPGKSFDYVEEGEMCESCGGEMNEGECSECGNMYEIDLQEEETCESCGYSNESEVMEKLHGNQKRIDKNHNGKIDSEDFKMLRKDKKEDVNENVFYELTTAVNGKREKLLFNESQFEEMIENIVLKEEGKFNKGKTPAGYAEYERSIKTSKKNEEGYMKDLAKKMKDYLKDGSKGKYEMSPKHFPKGNCTPGVFS